MMAAIIRIKRRLDEDPLEAVLLNCKKLKTEAADNSITNEDGNDLSTIFKLAGTITSQDEDILKHIKKFNKTETEQQYKKHISNYLDKIRAEKRISIKNKRFKVINSFRNPLTSEQSSSLDQSYTIFDIEGEEEDNSKTKLETEYVYDLYYGHPKDVENADLNEFLSVYPLSDHPIYNLEAFRDKHDPDSDYSEDSNAENNWKNDYPDESDSLGEGDSINEKDILGAMNRVALGDSDLSSDESFGVYGIDGYENGKQYARFKARYKEDHDDSDNEYDISCTP